VYPVAQHLNRPYAAFLHTTVSGAFAKQFQFIYQLIFPCFGFLTEQPSGNPTNKFQCLFIAILA